MVVPRILLATDCTSAAHAAFHWAAFIAARLEATLDVIHTYNSSLDRPTFQAQADAKSALRSFVGGTKVRGPKQVVRRIEMGDAAQGILHVAMRESFGLVVVGSHNQGPALRVGLGRVAQSVVQGCAAQVLVVPPGAELVGPDGAAGAFDMPREGSLPRVVVPIDFSPRCEKTFAHAVQLASSLQLQLVVFHALGAAGDRDKAASGLASLVESARESSIVCEPLIREGEFSSLVEADPIARPNDLVVMGASAGFAPLKRSVEDTLTAHRSPILVVRDRFEIETANTARDDRASLKGVGAPATD